MEERRSPKPNVVGSNPAIPAIYINDKLGRIAQLGEHLPYKQGVTGSSPVVPTNYNIVLKVGSVSIIQITTFLKKGFFN